MYLNDDMKIMNSCFVIYPKDSRKQACFSSLNTIMRPPCKTNELTQDWPGPFEMHQQTPPHSWWAYKCVHETLTCQNAHHDLPSTVNVLQRVSHNRSPSSIQGQWLSHQPLPRIKAIFLGLLWLECRSAWPHNVL